MAGKAKKPNQKLQAWIDARKRHHLSDAQIQMARELGMNPAKLGKLDNHDQEPWKLPLPQFIEELYFKRRGKTAPDAVTSIPPADRERASKGHGPADAAVDARGELRRDSLMPAPASGRRRRSST